MNDQDKPREQLLAEFAELRRRVAALEDQLVKGKQAEAALCRSVHLHRAILDNIPESVWVESLDGRVEAVNKAWRTFAGLTREEAPGQLDTQLFPSKTAAGFDEQDGAAAEAKQPHWEKETIQDGNGNLRILETFKVPLSDLTGCVTGTIGVARDVTERAQYEQTLRDLTQALQESQESLQFVLQGSRLGTWDWNIETGEVKRNDYWAEMLGYTPREVNDATADSWLNLIHPDDRELALRSIENNVAGRTAVHEVEYRMRARDGSYRWILDRARVVCRDREGRARRMSGTHQDITERKQMEDFLRMAHEDLEQRVVERTVELIGANDRLQAEVLQRQNAEATLREERQRLADIIEADQAGTWEWNVQTGEMIFNERWAQIIGYALEEVSPTSIETWIKFVHPDDLPASEEMLAKHFRGELAYYDIHARMKHKDGSWVWIRDRGKVISWTDAGQSLWMRGTHHDITHQKHTEEALKSSESRFRAIVDQAADAVFVQDYSGRFLDVNPRACSNLGYSREELLQMSLSDVETEFDLVKDQNSNPPMTPTTPRTVTGRQRRKDGSTFPVEVRVSCIDLEGQRYYLCLVRDVTQREQQEMELNRTRNLF